MTKTSTIAALGTQLPGGLKRSIKRSLSWLGLHTEAPPNLSDIQGDSLFRDIYARAQPFTMTSPERAYALYQATRHVIQNRVPGAFVECGVWRGGSAMIFALTSLAVGDTSRDIYLFDTFEGMPQSDGRDITYEGLVPTDFHPQARGEGDADGWLRASLEEVRSNLLGTGYPPERLIYIKGLVEETIPGAGPDRIALLRLDTDFYESTKHELLHLYPRLSAGGVLIIDDYGYWRGSKEATDEYFADHHPYPLLQRIDFSGRLLLKGS
jgi:O-methyltransferase